MNNKQMISAWKRQDVIRKRITTNKQKRNRLINSIAKDENSIRKFNGTNELEIHHGKLLDIEISKIPSYGISCSINPLAEDNNRYAEIYTNQHNKKTFGAHLKILTFGLSGSNELFLGARWEDFDDILKVCIKYVAKASLDYIGTSFLDTQFKKTLKKFSKDE